MLMVAATDNKHRVLRYLLALPSIDVDLQGIYKRTTLLLHPALITCLDLDLDLDLALDLVSFPRIDRGTDRQNKRESVKHFAHKWNHCRD